MRKGFEEAKLNQESRSYVVIRYKNALHSRDRWWSRFNTKVECSRKEASGTAKFFRDFLYNRKKVGEVKKFVYPLSNRSTEQMLCVPVHESD